MFVLVLVLFLEFEFFVVLLSLFLYDSFFILVFDCCGKEEDGKKEVKVFFGIVLVDRMVLLLCLWEEIIGFVLVFIVVWLNLLVEL